MVRTTGDGSLCSAGLHQADEGVEDAKLFVPDRVYKHLEKPASHARLLFADFKFSF